MANSANPEINKKIATSALGTLVIATVFFYLGDRYAETLVTYPGQIFDHLSDAFLSMWQTIKDAPFALDMTSNSLLFGGACFLIIWMIWLRYVAFIGNYRSGEESGSARWGTVKEGKKFKDLQTEDNNLLFTKNFGLALHRPKFDPEYDRNLNVLVVGGSGSGKTFNYVTPNICQLNTSYFVTDPKGTLLKDAGYLFTDNGYKLKSFNTINLDESMHYKRGRSGRRDKGCGHRRKGRWRYFPLRGSQGHDGSFQTACRRICRTFPRASGRKARPLPLDRTPESQQTAQPETQKG